MPRKIFDLSQPLGLARDEIENRSDIGDDESFIDDDVYSEEGLSQSVSPSLVSGKNASTHTSRSISLSRHSRNSPQAVNPDAFELLQSQVSELVTLINDKERQIDTLTSKLDRLEQNATYNGNRQEQDGDESDKKVNFDSNTAGKSRGLDFTDDDAQMKRSFRRNSNSRFFLEWDVMRQYESSYELEEAMITFDHDVFSLMMLHRVKSRDWVLAICMIIFQWIYLIIILINLIGRGVFLSTFDVPYAVETEVTVGQFLGIFIVVGLQSDVLSSIRMTMAMHANEDWNVVIHEPEKSKSLFFTRILLPNIIKFSGGVLVLVCNFITIVSSTNIVDLMKDVSALLIISHLTEIAFKLSLFGFLGSKLEDHTKRVQEMKGIKDVFNTTTGFFSKVNPRLSVFVVLSLTMLSFVSFMFHRQQTGFYFYQQYPYCDLTKAEIASFGDGKCDGGKLNSIDCAFDGGDCITFNLQYPNCDAPIPKEIGNGECNQAFNNAACLFDGGDCCPFGSFDDDNKLEEEFNAGMRLENSQCDGGQYFTKKCEWDNNECDAIRVDDKYMKCDFEKLGNLFDATFSPVLQDGVCESSIYNIEECGYEFGDCVACNALVFNSTLTGDGICHGGMHNSGECNEDARDCIEFNDKYPRCAVVAQEIMQNKNMIGDQMETVPIIGDGICNSGLYNNPDCGYEDGDCLLCNQLVVDPSKIGDGVCDGQYYMSLTCGYDGGDCNECVDEETGDFFPFLEIGNGWCSKKYNNPKCGFDGGDCLEFNRKYPDCDVDFPSLLGNNFCNGGPYDTAECGWDGGDCEAKVDFRTQNPDCIVGRPELLGDGICHGEYNTENCAYDAGDCLEFNAKYPNCNVTYPSLIGNGWCSYGDYDTEECGWDGGDCLEA